MKKHHFYLIGFSALMLFDTMTQTSFKLASIQSGSFDLTEHWFNLVFSEPWIYVAMIGYLGAFICWMTLLKHAPVGPAFAATHMEVVLVLIVSAFYFHEHLSMAQVIGALLIVFGIAFLSLSEEKQDNH
jgi:drug/metabolite transporter (DMT)-like permease